MSEQTLDTIGKKLKGGEKRDAVHFAVAPAIAGGFLRVGDRVKFAPGSTEIIVKCEYEEKPVGIVDPFLDCYYVSENERCWLFLLPNTITGLRHEWTHPAFVPQALPVPALIASGKAYSERWLRGFAERYYGDYDEMVACALNGEECCFGRDIEYEDFYAGSEFWTHIEAVTGKHLTPTQREQNNHFRCAC